MAEEGIRALAAALCRAVVSGARATSTRAKRCTLRRLALRHGARACRHGPASQALPHARRHASTCRMRETHTVMLPHALAYNALAAPECARGASRARSARARRCRDLALHRQWQLAASAHPHSLRRAGDAGRSGLDRAADLAVGDGPIPIRGPLATGCRCARLLQRAWEGQPHRVLMPRPCFRSIHDTQREETSTHDHSLDSHASSRARAALAARDARACRNSPAPPTRFKIGFVSPQTGPLAPFGEADKWVIEQTEAPRCKDGMTVGGRKVRRADRAQGQPEQPEPRGRGRQRPHPQGQGRARCSRPARRRRPIR